MQSQQQMAQVNLPSINSQADLYQSNQQNIPTVPQNPQIRKNPITAPKAQMPLSNF